MHSLSPCRLELLPSGRAELLILRRRDGVLVDPVAVELDRFLRPLVAGAPALRAAPQEPAGRNPDQLGAVQLVDGRVRAGDC